MRRAPVVLSATLVAIMAATGAHAQQTEAAGSAALSTEGLSAQGSSGADAGSSQLEPEPGLFELGVFGGLLWISERHNLASMQVPIYPVDNPLFEVGLRVAYFPLSFVGAELEGAWVPYGKANDETISVWAGRGHAILQVPGSRVTPFVLAGGGRITLMSDAMRNDGDPAFHYGGGVKVALAPLVSLRVDGRDNVTEEDPVYESENGVAHHAEVLLGLILTLGRSEKKAPPPGDRDGDGFVDSEDQCPDEKGVAPDGCPDRDPDGDGILDPDDKCPDEPGVAPDGCPDRDPDKDGILNPDDECPEEPGVEPHGCPDKDPDKDGIYDPEDQCPNEPETKNGYEDSDGCPDELPDEVKKFTGVIAGIEFDVNQDTIRTRSFSVLDEAVKVLTDYPELRIRITGHTDSDGTHEHNMDLSKRRADSVKSYLVDKGVSADRIETRGAGPDEPIADNDTGEGKQRNRRIEFKILK
jgi:outer membrane protein OmpA-like peptidoglycan-associated protein